MEGGITITNDEELYHFMLSLRAHGWTRQLPEDSKIYKKNTDKFYESFNFILPGYNLRPIEMEAAIGREQLKKLDTICQRRLNAAYFKEKMRPFKFARIQQEVEESSCFGFAIIVDPNIISRHTIIQKLYENEIEVRPIVAGNFTKNKAIEYFDYSIYGTLSNANDIHENGFFIGNHNINNYAKIDLFISILEKTI